jgi:hypothetical protein
VALAQAAADPACAAREQKKLEVVRHRRVLWTACGALRFARISIQMVVNI